MPNIKHYYSEDSGEYSLTGITNYDFDQALTQPDLKHLSITISQVKDEEGDFFVYVHDVTEKKIVEERLLNANSELEEFAYRTSHDLRSPIVSTLGLLKVANESLNKQDYATVKKCFSHSEKSLKKLEVLIRDILKLTETKNCEESQEVINLERMIKDSFDNIGQLDGFGAIDCRVDLQHLQPLVSKKMRVSMILENLISNAVKYQNPDSKSPYISIETRMEGSDFILSVSDNGLGIPTGQQHKLFKMFNRFHPKVAFGSGLGLYLMKKSAEVLGGDISYVDQDVGAKFKLTIPQSQENHLH